jgi:uncharacterized protein
MIRSLTIGLPIGSMSPVQIEREVIHLVEAARKTLAQESLTPRTIRFTLPALGGAGEVEGAISSTLRFVNDLAASTSVRWFCLPLDFVSSGPRRERLAAALDALVKFPRLFLNLIIANDLRIAVDAANDAAQFVLNVSRKTNNGFDNFRIGCSCNCQPNTPFFPFSRHEGEELAFSFAMETTAIALEATRARAGRQDLNVSRDQLVTALTGAMAQVHKAGESLAAVTPAEYRGLDASLAPLPHSRSSVGALVEQLLGAPIGSHGSVFITAILTDALRTALASSGARPVGFNGVMFAVLEDDRLASAISRRYITLGGLLSLSAICGCGIDMVPISGTSFQEEIAALILDVAGLSSALGKALGIRVLPIPNRLVNEFTQFNVDFLCDSRIIELTSNNHRLSVSSPTIELFCPLRPT